jgi:2,4-dienoyl-CoA reductase-like NADH-dependent reductase (Old Yellow Enzyme family)
VLAGHGYLINQFLSRRTNHRTDQWGGPVENRALFLYRIIQRVRSNVGNDYPLLVKLNTEDRVRNGLTIEESASVAERLQDLGVSAIKLTGGTFESALNISRGEIPVKEILECYSGWQKLKTRLIIRAMKKRFQFTEAYFLENTKRIKPRVQVPILLVGGLRTPKVMEEILRNGYADLLAIGRPLIRDPQFPKKILSGDSSPASCLNCNRCLIRILQERPLRCYAPKDDEKRGAVS